MEFYGKCMEIILHVNQQFYGGLVELRLETFIWKTDIEVKKLQN